MDIIRQAAQEIVADRNKIKNTDIKCGVSITDVIETELTDKRTAVDKVIADRNIIEVKDILGAVKVQDILPEKEPTPTDYLTIDASISTEVDLLGKTVNELQSNVVISNGAATGELFYVDDYTGFSSKVEEQSGNYLVIHCDTNSEEDIYVELVGGTKGPVKLDPEDNIIILRIADKDTQSVKATCGELETTLDISGLTIDTQE